MPGASPEKGDREAVEEVLELTGINTTRLRIFTSVVAPRKGAKQSFPLRGAPQERDASGIPGRGPQGR